MQNTFIPPDDTSPLYVTAVPILCIETIRSILVAILLGKGSRNPISFRGLP